MPRNSELRDTRTDTIFANTDKWSRLMQFASKNSTDWNPSPASHIADYYLRQDNFQLMGWNNGKSVVINFVDANGQANQLAKSIETGELNFLLK